MQRPIRVPAAVLAAVAAAAALAAPAGRSVELSRSGTYASGLLSQGGAEIVRFDSRTGRVFAVNAAIAGIDVIDASDPSALVKVGAIDVAATLAADPGFSGTVAGANSIAVHKGILAVAVEASPKTDAGWAAFYRTDSLELVGWVEAGALPDMVTFSPNGKFVLVANEGEPNSYGETDSVDPEGSVTVIRPRSRFRRLDATTIGFTEFNGSEADLRADGIRIFGPGASAAQDFEPESIAVAPDNRTAFVTLQENNAVAVLDLRSMSVARLIPLGFKDHSLAGNGLDASDRDGAGNSGLVSIANWPVRGLYMPDGIAAYRVAGRNYFVTANEGDSREDWFAEEARLKDLTLDPAAFPNAATVQNDDGAGRLTVTRTLGDTDADGDYDALYSFGARSFSIRDEEGTLVFDSGDDFETIIAQTYPANFNSDHATATFDTRSDNKGPEPEGVALGRVSGRTYAFIGLERIGGIMVYDVTDPAAPTLVQYLNNRDFAGDPATGTALDLGPEGLDFVPAANGRPAMLVVGNEISGTTSLFAVESVKIGK